MQAQTDSKSAMFLEKMWHNGRSWDRRRNATRSRHAHQHDDDTNHVAQAPNLSGKAIEA